MLAGVQGINNPTDVEANLPKIHFIKLQELGCFRIDNRL
jgi:hypothetical protein